MNAGVLGLLRLVFAAMLTCSTQQSLAETYPDKPIRIVIGQAPGGAVDTIARLLAERLTSKLGQVVYVESRAGAGGMLAADAVAKAPADGYVLGLLDLGALAVSPVLQERMAYDVAKDFAYLGGVAKIPLVLVANPSTTFRTLEELTAYAKARPGELNCASAGVGSPPHLVLEAYKQRARVFITHVPYRGGAPALSDVVAGNAHLTFVDANLGSQFAKQGRVVAIAMATHERSAVLPDVPTFEESGFKEFDYAPWTGLVAPAAISPAVFARLTSALDAVTSSDELAQRLQVLGFIPFRASSTQFRDLVHSEQASYRRLISEQNIKLDK
jgi:tripartite-type tricarboxylate transporter receptor subunit TctC